MVQRRCLHSGEDGSMAHQAPSWVPSRRGSHSTTAQTRHPRPPQQPSLCCLRGPAQQFHFPGGRRETREKERMLRPRGPGWCPRLCLPLLGVSSSTAQIPVLPSLCFAQRGVGIRGAHSDFHGSRPSQQHFGLRRDTERTRLIEAREKRRER